ncbi:hypothetical protein [Leifsonia shinshuensis]|uniref:hypothetical protein n=1 Tax=Leifsonia shinshuensis TaxID=150026 RepID=UPI0035BBBA99
MEAEFHQHFADRALNRANPPKESVVATPTEVREVLLRKEIACRSSLTKPKRSNYDTASGCGRQRNSCPDGRVCR